MSDGKVEVRPVDVYSWIRMIDSIDFRNTKAADRVAGRTIKGIAARLAFWGNKDGSEVLAGPARIAVVCEVDYKTAKTVLGVLRKCGLLDVVQRGRGPASKGDVRVGDEYRLTVPVRPSEVLCVRSKEEIDGAIEAVKEANRRKPTGAAVPRNSGGLRGQRTPVTSDPPQEVTGAMVPEDGELRGQWFPGYGGNGSAIPTQLPTQEKTPTLSLPDAPLSAPAPRYPTEQDRERDDETSSSTSQPVDPREQFATKHGAPPHLADKVVAWIEAANPIEHFGWWVIASRNGSLTIQVNEALGALADCEDCAGSGKLLGRNSLDAAGYLRDCPDCAPVVDYQRTAAAADFSWPSPLGNERA